MRQITIPDSIPDQDAITGAQEAASATTFYYWSCVHLGQDARFGDGGAATVARWCRLQAALRDAHPGDCVLLDEDDWQMARDAAELPKRRVDTPMGPQIVTGYEKALVAAVFMPFIEAWTSGTEVSQEQLKAMSRGR